MRRGQIFPTYFKSLTPIFPVQISWYYDDVQGLFTLNTSNVKAVFRSKYHLDRASKWRFLSEKGGVDVKFWLCDPQKAHHAQNRVYSRILRQRQWWRLGCRWLLDQHHHHNRFMDLFQNHPGEPVPEENLWTLWCKGRLTEADTPTIRLGDTPSGLTSANLHHPPFFLQAGCPSCRPTNSVKALKATNALLCDC